MKMSETWEQQTRERPVRVLRKRPEQPTDAEVQEHEISGRASDSKHINTKPNSAGTCVFPARNDPSVPGGHSKSFLGFVTGPVGPVAGSASLTRAGPARTGES